MPFDLIPRSFWNIPSRLPSILSDDDELASFLPSSGLTVSEDNSQVYVSAAVPGLDPKNIEVTFDKGVLWIRGQQEASEEDKSRKFYRRASTSYSYRVAVPGNLDEQKEPEVTCKNGVVNVVFQKIPETGPKKLSVKAE